MENYKKFQKILGCVKSDKRTLSEITKRSGIDKEFVSKSLNSMVNVGMIDGDLIDGEIKFFYKEYSKKV